MPIELTLTIRLLLELPSLQSFTSSDGSEIATKRKKRCFPTMPPELEVIWIPLNALRIFVTSKVFHETNMEFE